MLKDDLVYLNHMLDMAKKAIARLQPSLAPTSMRTKICGWCLPTLCKSSVRQQGAFLLRHESIIPRSLGTKSSACVIGLFMTIWT